MAEDLLVDPEALREQVRDKYREVAVDPHRTFPLPHRSAARGPPRLRRRRPSTRCPTGPSSPSPASATRSRCAACEPASGSSTSAPEPGSTPSSPPARSGAGGRVVGVDMTPEMLKKSRATAEALGFAHVEFREGLAESFPVEDGWADAVISNGVINLCADKKSGVRQRSAGCSSPVGGCSSPTSPTADPCRPRRYATSTCGLAELREGCPVRAGRRCSRTPASSTCRSVMAADTFGGATGEEKATGVRGLRLRLPRSQTVKGAFHGGHAWTGARLRRSRQAR